MMFHPSLYPNLVRLYGYSSRSQKDKDAYIKLLDMRMKAKHGKLSEDVLKPMGLTNDDLKMGLKLPLNAYTGTLRASFNKNADFKQGFGICTTGQLLILQLVHDLQKIPTLEMVSTNTDAVKFYIDSQYEEYADSVIRDWEKITGLEMEKEVVVKSYMRDVNSYCEIVKIKDNEYEVHYKGGEFKGKHNFKWNKKEQIFEYSFDDELETNSLTIVSEALLKKLLFNISIEDTINSYNDIFRFQLISHMGNTYEKCVQESPGGDIELQKNNRIYASNYDTGMIVKIKSDGTRNTIALCPPNPIVDNKNVISIEDINKAWYIKIANQKLNDFLGVKRLTKYKKDELLELASQKGLEVDKKTKKEELIKLLEESEEKEMATKIVEKDFSSMTIYEKISEMTKEIREHDFILDCVNPGNLGGKEYASIAQYYNLLHNLCNKYHLLFKWDVCDLDYFEKDVFKPTGKMPSNVAVVSCRATFMDLDKLAENTGSMNLEIGYTNTMYSVSYKAMAGGSDIADKSVSGASTLAFRNWFDKNFTPKYLNGIDEEIAGTNDEQTQEPKIPTYIPPEKKEALVEKVVSEKQVETNDDRKQNVVNKIMEVREKLGNDTWGSNTVNQILTSEISEAELLSIELKVDNKLDSLK